MFRLLFLPLCAQLPLADSSTPPEIALTAAQEKPLTLSLNIAGGSRLQLSDGKIYAINPDDQVYSSLWITPFTVTLSESDDAEYPVLITNSSTGTSVRGRQLTDDEMREIKTPAQTPFMQPSSPNGMQPSSPKGKQPSNPNANQPSSANPMIDPWSDD